MNYFAHGYLALDDPYVVAGTALPDWLGATDRRARLRRERIRTNGCARIRSLAVGIRRHIEDDSWFHATEEFQRTWIELTQLLRDHGADSPRTRAWFLAHVLLEMLIDRFLYGYLEDRGLYRRLDGVARRVGLPPLQEEVCAALPTAAEIVEHRLGALMEAP